MKKHGHKVLKAQNFDLWQKMAVNNSQNKTKVLFVNLHGNMAGAEQSLYTLVKLLKGLVLTAGVCPAKSNLAKKLGSQKCITYNIKSPPRQSCRHLIWSPYFAIINFQMLLAVAKAKPDIIHANEAKAVLASILAKIIGRKKLIWHVRNYPKSALITRFCAAFCTHIIAVSKSVKNQLVDHGIKENHITVVYNDVEAGLGLDKKTHKNNTSFRFSCIGQLVGWKNHFLFIEAAEEFCKQGQRVDFFIVGDDIFGRDEKYKKELLERIKASPISSKIHIESWKNDLNSTWPQTDCLIHTADREPFGRVLIEAMANNVAVIAADSCGPAEIIKNGFNGLLFRAGHVEQLVNKMKMIFLNEELRMELVENAKKHVESNFSAKSTAEKIFAIYKKVMAT